MYNGFTGIVTQPIQGYKEEGRAGLYKGIGKGLGGILLKPLAGKPWNLVFCMVFISTVEHINEPRVNVQLQASVNSSVSHSAVSIKRCRKSMARPWMVLYGLLGWHRESKRVRMRPKRSVRKSSACGRSFNQYKYKKRLGVSEIALKS